MWFLAKYWDEHMNEPIVSVHLRNPIPHFSNAMWKWREPGCSLIMDAQDASQQHWGMSSWLHTKLLYSGNFLWWNISWFLSLHNKCACNAGTTPPNVDDHTPCPNLATQWLSSLFVWSRGHCTYKSIRTNLGVGPFMFSGNEARSHLACWHHHAGKAGRAGASSGWSRV